MNRVRTLGLLGILLGAGTCAVTTPALGSAFTLPVGATPRPSDGLLAQRTIDRAWGPSDDSNYVEVKVPGWRSEGTALTLSALAPGTGQLYAGEKTGGLLFVLGEAFGWFEWSYMRHRGRVIRNDAMYFAGDPNDSLSRWSFAAYEQRTGQSAGELRRIYAADRSLFYYLIARDDGYRSGWEDFSLGYNAVERDRFIEIREDSQAHFKRARYFQAALWANHVIAAVHAMRVARSYNLQFSRTLKLGVKTRLTGGGPSMAAVIEARF